MPQETEEKIHHSFDLLFKIILLLYKKLDNDNNHMKKYPD